MKTFACVLLFVALATAEPPRYRQARYRSEGEDSGKEQESENAPYPSSGFKPEREFRLPARQELTPPATSYGAPEESFRPPLNAYAMPQAEYGLPKGRSFEGKKEKEDSGSSEAESLESGEKSESSSEEGSGEEKKGEKSERREKSGKHEKESESSGNSDDDVVSSRGAYYVLLPGSQLQRVQFQTQNDISKMAYTAKLQYRNEDRAPVYLYTAPIIPQIQPSAAYSTYTYQW